MPVDPLELRLAFDQALAGDWDDQIAVRQPIDPVQVGGQVDLRHHGVGVESRILGAVDQEAEERLQVERVVRPGRHQDRVRIVFGAIAGGVADRTVVGDTVETDAPLGKTDRQLPALLPGHTERGIAARAGQLVGKHARQHVEDPVGDAGILFGADGSVFETFIGIIERLCRIGAQEAVPANIPEHDHDDQRQHTDHLQPARQTTQKLHGGLPVRRS